MKKLIIKGLVLPRQTLLFYTDPELGWQDGGTPFIVTEEGDYVIEVDRQERDSFKCYVLHPNANRTDVREAIAEKEGLVVRGQAGRQDPHSPERGFQTWFWVEAKDLGREPDGYGAYNNLWTGKYVVVV